MSFANPDISLQDAADFLSRAAGVVNEARAIRNPALRKVAIPAARLEVQKLIALANESLKAA